MVICINIEDIFLPHQDCIGLSYTYCWPSVSLLLLSRLGFSNINIMSVSLNNSILNLSRYNSYSKTAMLIRVLCNNVLGFTLSTYFGRSHVHLPTVKQLFSSRCWEDSLGPFSPRYFKLAVHVYALDH